MLRRAGIHLPLNLQEGETGACEHTRCHRLLVAKEREQQMLGFDVRAAPLKRFVACEEKCASRLFRVALEHDAGEIL